MLQKVIAIALLHIKIVLQPINAMSLLIIPILFTFLIGLGANDGSTNTNSAVQRIAIVNEDSGELSQLFIEDLNANASLDISLLAREAALGEVEEGQAAGALLIPPEFSATLLASEQGTLTFLAQSSLNPASLEAEQTIRATVIQLASAIRTGDMTVRVSEHLGLFADTDTSTINEKRERYFNSTFTKAQEAWQGTPPIVVAVSQATQLERIPEGTTQSSPGMLVMFSLFFLVSGGAVVFIEERERGTLRRLLVTPTSKSSILLGKFLGIYTTGLLQIVALILSGIFLFNVNWGQSPAALSLVVLTFALAATSLGLLMASFVNTQRQANRLLSLAIMAISALGGAWWPLEIVPTWMQTLAYAFPTAWAMNGFHDIISRGLGVEAVLPEVGLLLAFAVFCFTLGVSRFRYE